MAGTPTRSPLVVWADRLLFAMSSWTSPRIFGAFLLWFGGWTVAMAVVVEVVLTADQQYELSDAAVSVVGALGVLFSFLTGFVITGQWSRSRTAEGAVHSEADAAVRLALASQSRDVHGSEIRRGLAVYLRSVVEEEWETLEQDDYRAHSGTSRTREALDQLERDVRRDATTDAVRSAVTDDLLRAAEGLAIARRYRLNLAGHGLPVPLFVLVFTAGVILSINAIAIASARSGFAVVTVFGLVLLIALDLALILALSDPFRGPMRAGSTSIAGVLEDLENERYGELSAA